jgi:ubiquinone/menaquinone biosynthesis C-methylase UbiE
MSFSKWSVGGEEHQHQDRFNEMEHRNWEHGYEVYDQGFGPLTQQAISNLLASADFPPAHHHDDDNEGRLVRLLDVATGPGFVLALSLDDAETQQQTSFHLTGLDISQNFLTLAEQRLDAQLRQQQNAKQINIDFVEGSAELLPFPENTFDSIVCNFGILHFFEPNTFLRESYRALRPGGKISFSAWAPPTRTQGFQIALSSIAEAGNPNVVDLPEGPNFFDFGDAQHATSTLQSIGFENVKSVELSEMKWSNMKNGAMLYEVLLNGTSRTREILLGQTPEQTVAIQALMVKKYDLITDGGTIPLSMPAVVTSGQKPK